MESEKTSVECWEFIFHEKLHSFAPTHRTAVLKSFFTTKGNSASAALMPLSQAHCGFLGDPAGFIKS